MVPKDASKTSNLKRPSLRTLFSMQALPCLRWWLHKSTAADAQTSSRSADSIPHQKDPKPAFDHVFASREQPRLWKEQAFSIDRYFSFATNGFGEQPMDIGDYSS